MISRYLMLLIICMAGFVTGVVPYTGDMAVSTAQASTRAENTDERYITIDFDNVDINLFIKYISELTGKNFIVDPLVKGNVSIISPTRISEADAYRVFESVLEIHGFTTVSSGSVTKIIPSVEARSRNIDTLVGGESLEPGDRVVTQLVPLTYTSPLEMQKVLQPLVSKTSVVIPHTQSGMLIITESLSNIKRLMSIIKSIDVKYSREEVAVIPLEYANADKIANILNTVYQETGTGDKGKTGLVDSTVKVVPYERINTLVVLAEPADTERLRNLVTKLDTEARRGEGNIHVYYLQNATASELAKVLSALPQQDAESVEGKAPAISKSVSIMPDEETNSLIITASRSEYAVLEDVIKKLDIPRRMVYLEALIMEVDADKTFDVGVEWAAGGTFSDDTGQVVSGFSGASAFSYIAGATDEDDPTLPTGFSLGLLKEGIEIGGITFPSIAAFLRAYKTDSDINIISNPQILTTDNKTAQITVGENVPYITSENTTASEQDYTQYEYKDVATKLSITPHINQADTLRLEIETEVIKLQGGTESLTPTTYKRTAVTTVIVDDKDTVVIGGIIGQDSTVYEWKVPLLGDIPLLGWLFKTRSTTSERTNMFIFITPHIVRNPADIAAVTLQKEAKLGAVMEDVKQELHPEADPEQAVKLADIGFEKLRMGKVSEAKNYLQNALEVDPSNPYALINMGVALEKEGDYTAAIQMYQKVIATGTDAAAKKPEGYNGEPTTLVWIAAENIEHVKQLMQEK